MGDEAAKFDADAIRKFKEEMEEYRVPEDWGRGYRPPLPRPKSKRWDTYKIIQRGVGSPPWGIAGRALGANERVERDYTTNEWCWYEIPDKAVEPNKPEDNATQATIRLLKDENAKLWGMLEALARRMDRMEFNAALEDDDDGRQERADAGGNEEPPTAASRGTGVSGPEGESVRISETA